AGSADGVCYVFGREARIQGVGEGAICLAIAPDVGSIGCFGTAGVEEVGEDNGAALRGDVIGGGACPGVEDGGEGPAANGIEGGRDFVGRLVNQAGHPGGIDCAAI